MFVDAVYKAEEAFLFCNSVCVLSFIRLGKFPFNLLRGFVCVFVCVYMCVCTCILGIESRLA